MVEAMVALVLVDQLLQQYAQCQLLPLDPVLQGSELPKREPTPLEEAVLFGEH
jgi:chorismate synthase